MDSVVPPCNKLNFDIVRPDIGGKTLHYTFFQYPDSSISMLRNVFIDTFRDNNNEQTVLTTKNVDTHHIARISSQFIHSNKSECHNSNDITLDTNEFHTKNSINNYFPTEYFPSSNFGDHSNVLSSIEDITELFNSENIDLYGSVDNVSYLTYTNDASEASINSKLEFIYEALNANISNMTLDKLEGFLRILISNPNPIGTLTPYGSLMAHTCLQFLKTYIVGLSKSNSHAKDVILHSVEGKKRKYKRNNQVLDTENATSETVSSDFSKIAMFNFELYSKQLMDTIHSQDISISKNKRKLEDASSNLNKSDSVSIDSISVFSDSNNDKRIVSQHTLKSIKQGSTYLQNFISMYRVGFEPHFPRIVCGRVDRSQVTSQASITVPIDTAGRSVHIAFESLSDSYARSVWPKLNELPKNIQMGSKIQIAWHKTPGNMRWYTGNIVQAIGSQYSVQVHIGKNEYKIRYCMMKYFVPPNLPTVKPDKGWWRLAPREINLETDLYVGSCISLYDIISDFESIDCVICNVYYNDNHTPSAPIKSPDEEIYKSHIPLSEFIIQSNCACSGPSRRIRQGALTPGVTRIHIYCMSHKIDKIIPIKSIKGYKLNYDLHAHFDGQPDYGPLLQSTTWAWVIPRQVMIPEPKYENEKYWTCNPAYSLVIFPYHRNMEYIISATKLISILHAELNVSSLYTNGEWFVMQPKSSGIKGYSTPRPSGLTFSKTPLLDHLFGCHRIQVFNDVGLNVNNNVEEVKTDYSAVKCTGCGGILFKHAQANQDKQSSISDVEYKKKIQIAAAIRWKRVRESSNTILNCYNENDELVYRTKNSFSLSWEQDGRNAELAYRRAHAPNVSKLEPKYLEAPALPGHHESDSIDYNCTEGLLEKFNESVKCTDSKNTAKLLEDAILGGWMNDNVKSEVINARYKNDDIFKYINKSIQAKAAQDALDFLKNCSPPCLSRQVGKHYTPINGRQSIFNQFGSIINSNENIPHLDLGNPMLVDYTGKKDKLREENSGTNGLSIYDNPFVAPACDPGVTDSSLRNFLSKTDWDEEIEEPPLHQVLDFTVKSDNSGVNDGLDDCAFAIPIDNNVNIIWSDNESAQ